MDSTQGHRDIYPNGTVIAQRYRITSFLAQGGMAQVYVACQLQINREVALKVLAAQFSTNPNVVMRFFREAQVVGRLTHPNTVRLYDMGETPDKRLFIAMELLHGEELSERIKQRGHLEADESLVIMRQVAGSLYEAHQMGVIHRDLKPDNIFLTTHQEAKVLDFGIAKLKDDSTEMVEGRRLTKAGTAPGTPEYMSPEQARGKELDGRSDLYSLGVVLYEMLCGHPPFEDSTFLGTILMQVQSPPPPLPDYVPQVLRDYIINRLLSKDPAQRPDDAGVFMSEIDEIRRQLAVQSDPRQRAADAQLDQARAEIEALRRELAQTRRELERANEESPVPRKDPAMPRQESSMPPMPRQESPVPRREPAMPRQESSMPRMPRPEAARPVRRMEQERPGGEQMRPRSSNYVRPVRRGEPLGESTYNKPQPPVERESFDEGSASVRPVETLTGRQRRSSGVSGNPESTFMMYAQPLCSKMGPARVQEALHMAQGIWNAAVIGGSAINEIYSAASNSPALVKLIEAMLSRKEKFFADDNWQIDDLVVNTDAQGRVSMHFSQK